MSIEEYEKKFGEYWNDPEDLKAAAAELAAAEAEIAAADAEDPEAEKLNELSAIPKDEFERDGDSYFEGRYVQLHLDSCFKKYHAKNV